MNPRRKTRGFSNYGSMRMQKKEGFIKNETGTYSVLGEITERDIIEQASNLLYQDLKEMTSINSSQETKKFLQMKLGSEVREHLGVVYLNASHRVIEFAIEFSGTVDGAAVYPRHLLQKALSLGTCAALIIVHNHPGGSLEFSQADRNITKHIKEVLELCDIKLLDSLVVSREGSVSMAERGLL